MAERSGPIRDARRTRERIIEAAQRVFSSQSYAAARLSEIAAEAGINQALITRYFESKENLYASALTDILRRRESRPRRTGEKEGEQIVSAMLSAEASSVDPLPMIIMASSDPQARIIAGDAMAQEVLAPLSRWLGAPDGDVRAAQILALCAGLFTYRSLMPLDCFKGEMHPQARQWLEEAIQSIVDGSQASRRPPGDTSYVKMP